jgi:metal-sulfur cluster biosynthetic enzyme
MSPDTHLTEDMQRVWDALQSVRDPCHALSGHDLSIVDLGLVNEVSRTGDVIEIRLTFTEATCVFAHRIVGDLEDLAPGLPGVSRVDVVIEPLPIWEPSRMTGKARRLFEERRAAFDRSFRNIPIAVQRTAGDPHGTLP